MYDNLRVNGEEYISVNGEIICNEYLPENNPVNPESSFGWFIYLILGGGFDKMDDMNTAFLNDLDFMSATPKMLNIYGANMNLPRPKIGEGTSIRLLTDDEYRVYLYLRNCQLLTRLDLLKAFSHCMGDDTLDQEYGGVTITKEINGRWHAVDHLNYTSPDDDPSSNIGRNSDSDMDYIVKQGSSDEVYTIPGFTTYTGEYITYVNVPNNGWSPSFLSFLTQFISIKGNVLIREVIL